MRRTTHSKKNVLKVVLILGTAREGRSSEKAARFVQREFSKEKGVAVVFVDVRDFLFGKTVPPWAPEASPVLSKKWRTIAAAADSFLIVAPEYNHGYPGELKILLDTAYDEYGGKPVAICGVSAGRMGGTRMVEQLRLVTIELGLVPLREAVYFSRVEGLFTANGAIKDASYRDQLAALFKELIRAARFFRQSRRI